MKNQSCYQVIIGLLLPIAAPLPSAGPINFFRKSAVRSVLTGFYARATLVRAINCIESAKYNSLLDLDGQRSKTNPILLYAQQRSSPHRFETMQQLPCRYLASASRTAQQYVTIKLHHRSSGGWHIIANRGGRFVPGKPGTRLMQQYVRGRTAGGGSPHWPGSENKELPNCAKAALQSGRASDSCVNAVENHDGRYDLSADDYLKFLDPYLPNRSVFRCPSIERAP